MKPREPRLNVLVGARMRLGASWGDVSILNVSSRGLMLHARQVPARGSYLEVRRGQQVIIAQVVWSKDQRFGVKTQDKLCVEAIIREPDRSGANARQPKAEASPVERRNHASRSRASQDRHEHSRTAGRAIEFACIGIAGVSAALAGYSAVVESFGRPLTAVSAALKAG